MRLLIELYPGILIVCLMYTPGLPSHAGNSNSVTREQILLETSFIEDKNSELSAQQALQQFRQGDALPVPDGRFNQGNTDSRFWLYMRLQNITQDSQTRLLDTGVAFRSMLSVFLITDADDTNPKVRQRILHTDDTLGFNSRETTALFLHSNPFTIPANSSVEILLEYGTRGATYMPLSIKTPEAFAAEQRELDLAAAVFYAATGILLLVFFVFGAALRNRAILQYATLFTIGLVFIIAVDGHGFKYIWPNSPMWNQYAGLFLWLSSISLSFFVSRHAMDPTALSSMLDRTLLLLAVVSALLACFCPFIPFSPLINLSGLLMVLAGLAQVRTVASWMQRAVKPHLISMVSMLIALPVIIALSLLALFDFDFPDLIFLYGNRALFLFTIAATLAALTIYILTLRREHEMSMKEALEAAQRDAQLSHALLQSEQKYARARELANKHRQQLASTSHDIRQPLTSLRAVINSLDLPTDTREHATISRALQYIEQLSEPGQGREELSLEGHSGSQANSESYRADLLLNTLARMFEPEAAANSIRLRTVRCSVRIAIPPLALMRILTNFTSNAIKHCDSGSVLLGCRRSSATLRFDVIDSGPGIDQHELQRLIKPYEKGDASEGEGLGLAICWRLAREHGFDIQVASKVNRGTRFSVVVQRDKSRNPADDIGGIGRDGRI